MKISKFEMLAEIAALAVPIAFAVALVCLVVASRTSDTERREMAREEAALARRWADRIGLRVVGAECDGWGKCSIVRDGIDSRSFEEIDAELRDERTWERVVRRWNAKHRRSQVALRPYQQAAIDAFRTVSNSGAGRIILGRRT